MPHRGAAYFITLTPIVAVNDVIRPNVVRPNVIWPNVVWPNVVWPNVVWPTSKVYEIKFVLKPISQNF